MNENPTPKVDARSLRPEVRDGTITDLQLARSTDWAGRFDGIDVTGHARVGTSPRRDLPIIAFAWTIHFPAGTLPADLERLVLTEREVWFWDGDAPAVLVGAISEALREAGLPGIEGGWS